MNISVDEKLIKKKKEKSLFIYLFTYKNLYFFATQTYAAEGRFTFTSHAAGEHIICLNSNSTAWLYAGQLVSLLLAA